VSVELAPTIEGNVLNYRYQIEQVFNDKGGMGLIYQATDLNLRSTVVLKKSRFVDEQSRSAFEREARLLYGLRHNALPRVIDYFITEDGSQFFVMEFIPGQDLSEMLSDRIERGEGPFPITQVLDWGDQLLDALHYLHMHNPPIIHRDIKPQNLKVMPNGQIILLDFGLAKGAVSGMTLGSASIQGYTPNYAPLEQMRGSGTDARSDIYSLAVTMHCLLSGQMPPDAVSRAIETLSAQPDPLRPLHEINLSFPMPVSEALQRACSLNQNERPATAQAMREVLRQARAKLARIDSQILSELKFDTNPSLKFPSSRKSSDSSPIRAPQNEFEKQSMQGKSHRIQAQPAAITPIERPQVTASEASKAGREALAINALPEKPVSANKASQQPRPLAPEVARVTPGPNEHQMLKPWVQGQSSSENSLAHTENPVAPATLPKPALVAAEAPGTEPGHQTYDTILGLPSQTRTEDEPSRQQFDTIVGFPAKEATAANVAQQNFDTMVNALSAKVVTNDAGPALAESVPAPVLTEKEKSPKETLQRPPDLRPTSLFVIEHKDDGKRGLEAERLAVDERNSPPVHIAKPGFEAPLAPPLASEQVVKRAGPSPHPINAKPKPRPLMAQPTALRRPAPLAHEVEKPSQGDVLPNIDMTGMIGAPNSTAVPPKGMRSYTEVIALNVRMEMHAIPGGEFLMGSPEKQGYADEYPLHRATLSPFYIGKYPITQSQWRAVMRTNPSHFNGPNHPVDSITWDEAFEYCRRLSYATGRLYRLPTEAEWEFACRAGMQTQFNYGDEEEFVVQYAWCLTNSGNHTHPVGEKKPNGWGLYDMHGNVWEWCHDWYAADYYQHSPKVNPFGPAKGTSRVLRGGSWYSLPNYCRNAGRSNHQPDQRDPLVGFRVVCEARNT
jgi:formylglycine-generating enzyme required for sulfatase activity/serine/threonine protein kinase